jgi:dienelactone hydrolase
MEGYTCRSFTASLRNGFESRHDVYERGEGPPIVLVQELPGIGQETLRLADRLVAAGYRVVMPHLFGPLGRTSMVGNLARVFCMRREFSMLSRNESSPIVDWLRALCRDVRDRTGTAGVGVIGMCLTGNFALTLIGDESVLAAVASQPSLPGVGSGMHMSATEIEASRESLDACGPMLALRFEGDRLCRPALFDAIDAAFNEPDHQRVQLEVLPGRAHAVLTLDFVDREGHPTLAALDKVLSYFADRLQA